VSRVLRVSRAPKENGACRAKPERWGWMDCRAGT
jgi:hypothetical protein